MIRLICMDMDGVLTQHKNFWLRLHEAWGTSEEGEALTETYLRTDYPRLMREVLDRLWIGKDHGRFDALVRQTPLSQGTKEFFEELDRFQQGELQYFSREKRIPLAIISSGPYQLAAKLKDLFGIDFIFGNELIFEDGTYQGKYHWHMMSGDKYKADILHQLCDDLDILPQHVLYIGDDRSDLEAFREIGFSIAFNSRCEDLKEEATFVVESSDLRDVIPILQEIRGMAHQA